jgi:CRISPR-associated endonuclease Csn1
MEEQKYFLGLDIGTDSVGWCVTDRDYHIVRKQGKHLWGARLFGEANPAADRRMNRENRRRLERRRWRIVLLQGLFNEAMNKVDPDFFARLNNSALHKEDKPDNCKVPCLLFNKEGMTDHDFYHAYPTIYHLRLEMIQHPEKQYDLREIYLVLAHMIKYRGNFLMEGEMKSIGNDPETLVSLFNQIDECLKNGVGSSDEDDDDAADSVDTFACTDVIAQKLMDSFKKISRKQELLEAEAQAFSFKPSRDLKSSLLRLINGSHSKLSGLFLDIEDEETSETDIDFTSDAFDDEVAPKLPDLIGDDRANLLLTVKRVYDYRILISLLKGKPSLSEAMIDTYNTHHEEVKVLKRLYKDYARDKYADFFRKVYSKDSKGKETLLKNYVNYVGYNKVKNKSDTVAHSTSLDDLYKTIKTDLPFDKIGKPDFVWKNPTDAEDLRAIADKMEANAYLPRQNSRENGVFPYQLNEMEMVKILDNQKQYYPFLGEYTDDKKTTYKIVSILKFKIPYYVGPLSDDAVKEGEESNKWAVKKVKGVKITPWNFDEVIDKDETAKAFIERMKNSCTYLFGEETLPKNSLLYSEFMLFNEINNWMVNGKPMTFEDKTDLINHVYLKTKKVGIKAIEAFFKEKYKESVALTTRTGKDLKAEDLHANLSPFIDMANEKAFGSALFHDDKAKEKAEEVIYDLTMFEDKKIVAERLAKRDLTEDQKKYFLTLNYSGWGKMSRRLLEELKSDVPNNDTGEVLPTSIMDLMRHTSQNFMEIYETSDQYTFKKQVENLNGSKNLSIDEIIDDEYASPDMKRALRQTEKIVEELKKILHIDGFNRYFVECTRKPDDIKKRTTSRKKQLEDVYKAAKALVGEEVKENLEKETDARLRSKKIFLYYMQLGHSVYSGEPIRLEDLDKDYDVDHIIPQAKVKDDSFINTVLVEKTLNNKKQDLYPIPESILSEKGRAFIETLSRIKGPDGTYYLMPKEKKDRLTRSVNKPLTEDEEVGFVNRQLTMTDQAVKAVCDVLKVVDKNATIVYSKAGLVSDFRRAFNLIKCRDINDFHHANDAYLNIVVGNVYNRIFSSCFNKKDLEARKEYYEGMKIDADHLFKQDQYIFPTNTCIWKAMHYHQDDNGDWIEDPTPDSSLTTVRHYMSLNDPMVTQMLYTQPGFFNKISIHSVHEGGALMPLKASGPYAAEGWKEKYGGYADMTSPYFMLVRSEGKKEKRIYSLEAIPAVFQARLKTDQDKVNYLVKELGLKNPEIKLPKLLIRTVLEIPTVDCEGRKRYARVGISGRTGNAISTINLSELALPGKYQTYCKDISKLLGTNLPANQKKDLSVYSLDSDAELIDGKTIISKPLNQELFDFFVDIVFKKSCFLGLPEISTSALIPLQQKKEDFASLHTLQQTYVLHSIMSLLSCKNIRVDLSSLKLSKVLGSARINKVLPLGTRLIAQSMTGFYEKVLFTVPED